MAMAQPAPQEVWDDEPDADVLPLTVVPTRRSRVAKSPRASVPVWVVVLALTVVTLVAAMATYLFLRSYP